MSDPPNLLSLPPHLVDRILHAAILVDPPTASRLELVSRATTRAARRVCAHHLHLPDDDTLLYDAQALPDQAPANSPRGPAAVPPPPPASVVTAAPAVPSLLDKVARSTDWALDVRHCTVAAPAVPADYSPPADRANGDGDSDDEQHDHDDVPVPPLDDTAFFLLVSRLSNLTAFTWSSYRLPPDALCLALGQACKSLTAFKLDLVPSPFAGTTLADHHHHGLSGAAPGSPQQLAATSPSSPPSFMALGLGGNGHGYAHGHASGGGGGGAPLRWDAPHLSALPHTLVRLAVSHLSAAGARSLAAALPSFPALETLELARTLFVDDALVAEVGAGARGLKRLVVRDMGGTKLSEQGLQALFDGCEALEVLELDCVEGRFSRTCWQKLAPLPSSLHTLRLVYSEHQPHKSWVVDHLSSLPAILGLDGSSLHTLSVTRRPHPCALVPGSHHLARYPIEPVVEPRPLGAKAIDALVERDELQQLQQDGDKTREWRVLELDLFSLDSDGLKRVLDGAPHLQRLQILFDSPFRNLLTLAPSIAACASLRHILVSVLPQHTPELAPLTPGREPKEDTKHHPVRALDPCLPPTRDWRRFCKKAHSVERVRSIARAALGTSTFSARTAATSLTRVEFEPTPPVLARRASRGGAGGTGDALAVDELGVGPQAQHRSPQLVPAAVHAQRRRSSTVSLAETCLSSLSLTNTSTSTAATGASDYSLWSESPTHSFAGLATPPLGAGCSPPFGSFAAAGRSVSPRKGSSGAESALGLSPPGLGYGSIGGGGGGAHRRRSSSAAVGQAQAYHAQPSAGLGLALHSTPASQQHGWATSPSSAPVAIPGATSSSKAQQQQQQQQAPTTKGTSPVSPRSFAQIAAHPHDKPWTRSASAAASASTASAGWAEPPTTGGGGGGAGSSNAGGAKRTKGEGSPTQGRRTRGGQGRRREATQ
ncbi:uncharacterized protein RHOBADRAFT_54868 [Rhodotorula graminis WP1]|uniref:F-box domain-containing protein n=1 Tax=Rhodotorula graminis (strain WP1) TaxID=578459 RepID=A0A0P9IVH2_RHOGW|nr:uncharacterized protein RHOBADRAFT_54868 [Rhodotorula graminis WP1]KPV73676.1 hypothetical protein RHOBADRAFT_54868 [Rhodotorula graminis WP1]